MHNYRANAIKDPSVFDETGLRVAAAVRRLLKD